MIVDLHNKEQLGSLSVGDVMVFFNGKDYDYYLVVKTCIMSEAPFGLVSLTSATLRRQWSSLDGMLRDLKNDIENNYALIEIIDGDSVKVGRVKSE